MDDSFEYFLSTGAKELNVFLSAHKISQFNMYFLELKKWSSKINLTAIRGNKEIVVKHFVDSLTPLNFMPQDAAVLDIGSGGGFPGIPLKIANPSLHVTLLDSTRKKVFFQEHVIRLLQLKGITAIHGRAEEGYSSSLAVSFNVVISRGFSGLRKFLIMAEPYVKKDGLLIAMRGREARKELVDNGKILTRLGFETLDVIELSLPFLHERRSIIVMKKTDLRNGHV